MQLLTLPILANVLSHLDAEAPFSLTCRQFYLVKQEFDHAKKVHAFITEHFKIVGRSSFVKVLQPLDIFRMRGVVLSEIHISHRDRHFNSALVNLLWRPNEVEVFLEAEDETQISGAHATIREQVKCWDIPQSEKEKWEPNCHLSDACCKICIAYLNHFTDTEMNFWGFWDEYDAIKEQLMNSLEESLTLELLPFCKTDKMWTICGEAEDAEPSMKRAYQIALIEQLKQEAHEVSQYVRRSLDKLDETRNGLLVTSLVNSIYANHFPIVVAGHFHVISDEVQNLSKKKGWNLLSLQPKPMKQTKPIRGERAHRETTKILNRIAPELRGTVFEDLPEILAGISSNSDVRVRAFITNNPNKFAKLRGAMKTYVFNEVWLPLWLSIPDCIYEEDLIRNGVVA